MNTLVSGLFFVSDGPVVVAGVTRIVLCRTSTRRYVELFNSSDSSYNPCTSPCNLDMSCTPALKTQASGCGNSEAMEVVVADSLVLVIVVNSNDR
jgi:hypothetical protein